MNWLMEWATRDDIDQLAMVIPLTAMILLALPRRVRPDADLPVARARRSKP